MLPEIVDQFYLDQEKSRKQNYFYVTDAGRCHRYIFFKFKQAPRRKMEARILRLFDHGNYIHRLIIKALEGKGVLLGEEVNIPPSDFIHGRADAILSIDNEKYILDIKSINSFKFGSLKNPSEEYINQLQLYLHFFKIKKGVILYVNKDTQALKEFFLDYDAAKCNWLLDDLKEIKKEIEKKIVSSRLPGWPSNSQCRYCPFKEVCSMIGDDQIYWDEFKDKIQSYEESIQSKDSQKSLFSKSEKSS